MSRLAAWLRALQIQFWGPVQFWEGLVASLVEPGPRPGPGPLCPSLGWGLGSICSCLGWGWGSFVLGVLALGGMAWASHGAPLAAGQGFAASYISVSLCVCAELHSFSEQTFIVRVLVWQI